MNTHIRFYYTLWIVQLAYFLLSPSVFISVIVNVIEMCQFDTGNHELTRNWSEGGKKWYKLYRSHIDVEVQFPPF